MSASSSAASARPRPVLVHGQAAYLDGETETAAKVVSIGARRRTPIILKAAVGAEFSFRLRAPSIPGCVSLVSDAEERAKGGL